MAKTETAPPRIKRYRSPQMLPNPAEAVTADLAEVSEIRSVSEIREAALEHEAQLEAALRAEPAYSVTDPLEGDALSSSARRRSEYPCAYDAIAFLEGPRVLTITWLPPAG
jgi:hypothetical protein